MEKIKKFFDIKTIQINKEYYEKLKKIDYKKAVPKGTAFYLIVT